MTGPPKSPSYISTPYFPESTAWCTNRLMHRHVTQKKKGEQNKHNKWKLGLGLCLHGNGRYGSQPKQCSLTLRKLERYLDNGEMTETSLSNPKNIPHIFQPKTINLLTKYRVSLVFNMRYRKWGEKRRFERTCLCEFVLENNSFSLMSPPWLLRKQPAHLSVSRTAPKAFSSFPASLKHDCIHFRHSHSLSSPTYSSFTAPPSVSRARSAGFLSKKWGNTIQIRWQRKIQSRVKVSFLLACLWVISTCSYTCRLLDRLYGSFS